MTVEIVSRSISMKVWDRARIELTTPGYAVRLATDCDMGLIWHSDGIPEMLILKKSADDKNACKISQHVELTLKAPITTVAAIKFCNIFLNFQKKQGMIYHENCLPADNSHEISCLICYFWKGGNIWNCCLLQIIGDALRVKPKASSTMRVVTGARCSGAYLYLYFVKPDISTTSARERLHHWTRHRSSLTILNSSLLLSERHGCEYEKCFLKKLLLTTCIS